MKRFLGGSSSAGGINGAKTVALGFFGAAACWLHGCYNWVRSKGYSGWLTVFAVSGVGLLILVCLPYKDDPV